MMPDFWRRLRRKPAPITIDLDRNMVYMDATHITERDVERMRQVWDAFHKERPVQIDTVQRVGKKGGVQCG